ncbi:MAG: type II secretion system GspH family protein [Acidobacteriia bacterium]|nr:type II secretion system GspH family protein [Terriglobia bacterium]
MGVRRGNHDEAGISLLEILIAISILAMSFTAIFSSMSAALRAETRLDQYRLVVDYATNKLNEVALDPNLEPGQVTTGVSPSGLRWKVWTRVVDTRPGLGPDRPLQLVRIVVEVSWKGGAGPQSYVLQTLKLRYPPAKSS